MSEIKPSARRITHVAVAVIRGKNNRILIAKRPDEKHMGGFWEFPGGKVESGECVQDALKRELIEEIGITILSYRPLIQVRHDYSDKSVLLDTWLVEKSRGTPQGFEGQEIRWVDSGELSQFEFPEANKPIITATQLPDQYMITGKFESESELFEKVTQNLKQGMGLIQFRAPWLPVSHYISLARQLHAQVKKAGGKLLLKGKPELLLESWCDGIHLRAEQLCQGSQDWFDFRRPGQWLSASCHNEEELMLASQTGMDFVTLSPVKRTATHPDKCSLGWNETKELNKKTVLPVYWLGGLGLSDQQAIHAHGGQGLAAIGAFWN